MDEWEAKYKILASGLSVEQIAATNELLERAKSLVRISGFALDVAVDLILEASKLVETKKPEYLGFPIIVGDWLPAEHAMIFGAQGAVSMNFKTGECKVASKEDLEKALRNILDEHNI